MDSTNLTLFAEELIMLLQKYNYRGIVGFVMDDIKKPACFSLTVAGEPPEFYQFMREHIIEMLITVSGTQPVESGEVKFVPRKPDTNEMPY